MHARALATAVLAGLVLISTARAAGRLEPGDLPFVAIGEEGLLSGVHVIRSGTSTIETLRTGQGLNAAWGVAVGQDGLIYVTDPNFDTGNGLATPALLRVNPAVASGVQVVLSGAPLAAPRGIATAPDGTLVIADSSAKKIFRVTTGGGLTTLWTGAPLQHPTDVAVKANGNVLVYDDDLNGTTNVRLYELVPGQPQPVKIYPPAGPARAYTVPSGNGGGIAVGADGAITIVAVFGVDCVVRFAPQAAPGAALPDTAPLTTGGVLTEVQDVTLGLDGNTYVADHRVLVSPGVKDGIVRVTPAGQQATLVTSDGIPFLSGIATAPPAVEFDVQTIAVREDVGSAIVRVVRRGGAAGAVAVLCATETGGTATDGEDFLGASEVLAFADGETEALFEVEIVRDGATEGNETVALALSSLDGAAMFGVKKMATLIISDYVPGAIAFSQDAYPVLEDAGKATISLVRTGGSDGEVTVVAASNGGTANAVDDYATVFTTVTFLEGETARTFDVTIADDALVEGTETVDLGLQDATNGAAIGTPAAATLAIVDVERGKVAFVDGAPSASESAGRVRLAVRRTGGADGRIEVDYATGGGTATEGDDHTKAEGMLVFESGASEAEVEVEILEDHDVEGPETIGVALTAIRGGAALGTPAAVSLTILDDDEPIVVAFGATEIAASEEPNAILQPIEIVRAGGLDRSVTVDLVAADDTATRGADYSIAARTSVAIPAGETSAQAFFRVLDDAAYEGPETAVLSLELPAGGPAGVSIGQPATALLTIEDDEGIVEFAFNGPGEAIGEGEGPRLIEILRTGDLDRPASVDVLVGGTATLGADYTLGRTPVNGAIAFDFAAGETQQFLLFQTTLDIAPEGDETVTFTLSVPAIVPDRGLRVGSPGAQTWTIVDDTGTPTVRFQSATYTVNEGVIFGQIGLERQGGIGKSFSANVAVAGGTAEAGADFNFGPTVIVSFGPNETEKTFSAFFLDDSLTEDDETFTLSLLSSPGDYVVGDPGVAVVTIEDDEGPMEVAFESPTYGAFEDSGEAEIALVRTGDTRREATVRVRATGDTATPDVDYTRPIVVHGVAIELDVMEVHFERNATRAVGTIHLRNDAVAEGAETVDLRLELVAGDPDGRIELVEPDEAVLAIADEPSMTFRFTAASATVVEGGQYSVTVERSGDATRAATVRVGIGSGAPFPVFFPPGTTEQTLTQLAPSNGIVDGTRTIEHHLVADPASPLESIAIGEPSTFTLTVLDDEGPFSVALGADSYEFLEGFVGTVHVVRTGDVRRGGSVVLRLRGGTATTGVDFNLVNQLNPTLPDVITVRIDFGPGETSAEQRIFIHGDVLPEGTERFAIDLEPLSLGGDPLLEIGAPGRAVVRIRDDDLDGPTVISFAQEQFVARERDEVAEITLVRRGDARAAATARVRTVDGGTAVAGRDFQAVDERIRFGPGERYATVEVRLRRDQRRETTETVFLEVDRPRDAAIAEPDTATLSIRNSRR